MKEGVTEDVVKAHFATFGTISSSCLKADKKGRPFAFVSFETHEEVSVFRCVAVFMVRCHSSSGRVCPLFTRQVVVLLFFRVTTSFEVSEGWKRKP